MTTLRVAIYDRLSKDRTGEAESVENRVAECRRYADLKGWSVVGEPYVDRDVSGYKRGVVRQAFDRLLADVDAGGIDVVLVWKLDRFGRRMETATANVRRIMDAGAVLVSTQDNIDCTTAPGRGVFALLVSFAEGQSEDTSKRVSLAWAAKAARGEPHVGGFRCFGFTKDCEQIPEEAAVAREVVDRVLAGDTLNGIARDLNERGVRSIRRGWWTGTNLRSWLHAPTLAGLRSHTTKDAKGVKTTTLIEGTWEGIITPEERDRLLIHLGQTSQGGGVKTEPKYLLTGIARCGTCGERFTIRHLGNGRTFYGCRKDRNVKACGKVSSSITGTDAYVVGELLDFLAAADSQPLAPVQDPKTLRASIAEDEAGLTDLARACYVKKTLDEATYLTIKAETDERLNAARAALDALETGSTLRPGSRDELEQWWAQATLDEQRAAIKDAFSSIVVAPATKKGPKLDTDRISLDWRVLADLTPVTTVDFGGRTGEVLVVPAERLNR